jgi:hypothetical protein
LKSFLLGSGFLAADLLVAPHNHANLHQKAEKARMSRARNPVTTRQHMKKKGETNVMKRAIWTVTTVSFIWLLIAMTPDIRRYLRMRSM